MKNDNPSIEQLPCPFSILPHYGVHTYPNPLTEHNIPPRFGDIEAHDSEYGGKKDQDEPEFYCSETFQAFMSFLFSLIAVKISSSGTLDSIAFLTA